MSHQTGPRCSARPAPRRAAPGRRRHSWCRARAWSGRAARLLRRRHADKRIVRRDDDVLKAHGVLPHLHRTGRLRSATELSGGRALMDPPAERHERLRQARQIAARMEPRLMREPDAGKVAARVDLLPRRIRARARASVLASIPRPPGPCRRPAAREDSRRHARNRSRSRARGRSLRSGRSPPARRPRPPAHGRARTAAPASSCACRSPSSGERWCAPCRSSRSDRAPAPARSGRRGPDGTPRSSPVIPAPITTTSASASASSRAYRGKGDAADQ